MRVSFSFRRFFSFWPVTLVVASLVMPPGASAQAESGFPDQSWAWKTPEEVDLDRATLEALAEQVGGSGVIVRDGFMVYEWGKGATKAFDWASASKPVLSTLLLLADQKGLTSLDTKMGWLMFGGSPKDSGITFYDLANNISGYSRGEGPGQAWAYNDLAANLFGYALAHRVFRASPSDVLDAMLGFLDFEDPFVVSDQQYGRIKSMSLRDFARLGLFWLERGQWDGVERMAAPYFEILGTPIPSGIPRTSVDGPESWDFGTFGGTDNQSAVGPGHYAFGFWVNSNGLWGEAPANLFQALGHFGRESCLILPDSSLIAVGVGQWGAPGSDESRAAIQRLLDADLRGFADGFESGETLRWSAAVP
jgi:CubicO group peptidase (beta-lactamase class C family)